MRCPNCNGYKKKWLGGNSFECLDKFGFTNQPCGFLYEDPVLGSSLEYSKQHRYEESIRCPECDELTEGIGENLEHLDDLHIYNDGYRNRKGWFHPDCWIKYEKHQRFLEIAQHKQLALLEKVSQIPCPHCGSQDICLSPGDNYPYIMDIHWECMNCYEEIDKKWLFQELKKEVYSETT